MSATVCVQDVRRDPGVVEHIEESRNRRRALVVLLYSGFDVGIRRPIDEFYVSRRYRVSRF